MPLLAAWTPKHWEVSHTDEIVEEVGFDDRVDLVGITANTPAAPHAYALTREFRRRGVAVVVIPGDVALRPATAEVALWLVPVALAGFPSGSMGRDGMAGGRILATAGFSQQGWPD